MRYVGARAQENLERHAYRVYVTETLRGINNNLAGYVGGATVTMSYDEVLNYKPETRTADEIKAHMKAKLKAYGGDGNGA